MEVKSPDWKDALETNNMVAIQIMHSNDPDLINEPIDTYGKRAIHLAIKTRNLHLLEYVLQNGADLNIKGGQLQNTALHEAVLLKDINIVRQLFSYSIDENIQNINNVTAFQLLTKADKKFKREYIRAKKFRQKLISNRELEIKKDTEEDVMMIAGMQIGVASKKRFREYTKETCLERGFFHKKEIEIHAREGVTVTKFGDVVGVDVDEIAMCLHAQREKNADLDIWVKVAGKATKLNKQLEIYKMLHTLTLSVIRKKGMKRVKKPKKQYIRDLTTRICKKVPKERGKSVVTREVFDRDFRRFLFEIHDEMVAEEAILC